MDIKLVDWEEGGYRVTDKVGPRGEIHVGGHHVAKGYYNMPEQTEAEFSDENGKRWFKSGDIGQVRKTTNLRLEKIHLTSHQDD